MTLLDRLGTLAYLRGWDIEERDGASQAFLHDVQAGNGPFAVTRALLGDHGYDRRGNQVSAPGRRVAYSAFDLPARAEGAPGEQVLYLHDDHLGSVETLTNAAGGAEQRFKDGPFGARASPSNPARAWTPSSLPLRKGFTGQEHEEELGLISMRGRVYDPISARFPSREEVVQNPLHSLNYNLEAEHSPAYC